MLFEALIDLDPPIGGGFDQMDSAARRFRFQAQDPVRRTLI